MLIKEWGLLVLNAVRHCTFILCSTNILSYLLGNGSLTPECDGTEDIVPSKMNTCAVTQLNRFVSIPIPAFCPARDDYTFLPKNVWPSDCGRAYSAWMVLSDWYWSGLPS